MKYKETVKNKKVIYNGRIIKLVLEDVVLPNDEITQREVIYKRNTVGGIVITEDLKIVLVKQFRCGIKTETFEIPAGEINDGETADQAIIREVLEETGYKSDSVEFVKKVCSSPATTSSYMSLFILKNAVSVNNDLNLDEDEFLERVELTFSEFEQLYQNGQITDMKTVVAYFMIKEILC